MSKKTHSLTIYLIKEPFTQEKSIVNNGLNEKEIDGIGKLFYKNSNTGNPSWMKLFKGYDIENLFSSSASAALIVSTHNRFFAVTFGPAARHFLKKGVWEERFGLLTTLNSVKKDSIRSIDTKTLESDGMQTRIQSARPLAADNFGIDVEKDLIRSVTGESKDITKFGKSLSGKDSLRVTLECDLNNLKDFLTNFLEQFKKDDYKTEFPWIDALKEINDLSKITRLSEKLLDEINKSVPNKLWLTVPEILDWTDHGGFKYSHRKRDGLLDDIHVDTFKEYLDCELIELYHLTENSIYRFSQSNEYQKDHWRVYECLYFEYSEGNETCFLTGGKWYAVKNNLVRTVEDYY
ncbi:TIGR04141 family sporadically distributed protein, partial [bacterium]|nr:TIGR04141 family sporadically distributed protein [bacterium]